MRVRGSLGAPTSQLARIDQPTFKRELLRSIRSAGFIRRFTSYSSSGLGHKVFILVDAGSNPAYDSIVRQPYAPFAKLDQGT